MCFNKNDRSTITRLQELYYNVLGKYLQNGDRV